MVKICLGKKVGSMKIGIFGGAFNPPHKMHKEIAINLLEKGYVDKIIYVPTGNNYNKPGLLDGKHRIEMLEIMFKDINLKVEVSDFEVKGSLYTINTLNHLKTQISWNCSLLIRTVLCWYLLMG